MTVATRLHGPATDLLAGLQRLTLADLPPDLAGRAVWCLLDSIACGFNGAQFPWGRIAREVAREEGSRGGATLLGDATPVAPARAALANGTLIHGFEMDDVILGALSHPGTVVMPAAFAVAEHVNAPVERLLLGLIAGYEVTARLGAALGERCADVGFHPTGIGGPIAAAVAVCVVLGGSLETMVNAVGIACSSGGGIKAFTQGTGGMVKRLHGGLAAEAGVVSALLAAKGFTGPARAVDGRFGLLEVFGGGTERAHLLTDGLGQDWALARTWTKVWPCCGVLHSAVHGLEALRTRFALTPERIAAVRIGTSKRGIAQHNNPDPRESMGAQYSLPFCAALALAGDAKDPEAYDGVRLTDPAVRALMPRVSLHVDPEIDAAYPDRFAARVAVETADGSVLDATVWDAHGMPADPCSGEEVEAKVRRLCNAEIGASATEAILAAARRMAAGTGTLGDLSAALRGAVLRRG
jgi:2-methylcitrate dehydratase PrpD